MSAAAAPLDADQFLRLRELFFSTLDLPPDQQDSYARVACGNDAALEEALAELLQQERRLSHQGTAPLIDSLHQVLGEALPEVIRAQSRLGSYTVVAEIGSGGMGRVFRAERRIADFVQTVAIKLLRQDLLSPDLLKRFSLERRLLAGLNHPGICRLIDTGALGDGTPYVVMELIEGDSLFEHADRQQLDIAARLRLFRKVLAAVSHAHRHLVVHRDLKSGNILVDGEGSPRLLDFGIAKALDGSVLAEATATRDRYVSFSNAAPEQLTGATVTVACDVYALGVILYELLCGLPPFDLQASAAALEQQILRIPPESMAGRSAALDPAIARCRGGMSLVSLRQHLSGDLERIVAKCLRKEPVERYASVEQLDEDIGNYLEQRPVRAADGRRWYRLRKFVGRHRLSCAMAAGLGFCLVALLATLFARNVAATRERDRAQQALAILRTALLSADPARVAGEDTTVRAVLDAARPALEPSFAGQPELYASLAATIAEVELSLGLATQSAELFDRAAAAAERGDLEPQPHFDLLVMRARSLNSAGEYRRALRSLDEAGALGLAPTPEWDATRGMTLLREGDDAKAVAHLRQAVARMADRQPDDEWATTARLQLADALVQSGAEREALYVVNETIAWQQQKLDEHHPRVALARLQLVLRQRGLRPGEEVIAEARKARTEIVTIYGAQNPLAAKAAMVLGTALADLDQIAEGAVVFREAIAILRQSVGDGHPNTLFASYNLAQMVAPVAATRAEALTLYRSTLAAAEQRFGLESNAVVMFRSSYARTLIADGQAAAALALMTGTPAATGLRIARDKQRKDFLEVLGHAYAAADCTSPRAAQDAACAAAVALRAAAAPAAPGKW